MKKQSQLERIISFHAEEEHYREAVEIP